MCSSDLSGYDERTPEAATATLDEWERVIGLEKLEVVHCNDSQTGLGSNRDRHANIGAGELGEDGCAAFLAARGLQRLPCVLETPGENRKGPGREEVAHAIALRERGLAALR